MLLPAMLRRLDPGAATCSTAARPRPRWVAVLMKKKYSSMMTDPEGHEPEAERQGDKFGLGNHCKWVGEIEML